MLVLSRKPGEEIIVGHNIRLRVVAIRGNQVQLGVTAPAETLILRSELCQAPELPAESNGGPATPTERHPNR
jgi:carbon storage regulator